MNSVDVAIAGATVLSVAAAYYVGLVNEIFSFARWLVAAVVGWFAGALFADAFARLFSLGEMASLFSARAASIFVLALALSFLRKWIKELIKQLKLGGWDKAFGGAFGLLRAYLIFMVLAIALSYTSAPNSNVLQGSALAQGFIGHAKDLFPALPTPVSARPSFKPSRSLLNRSLMRSINDKLGRYSDRYRELVNNDGPTKKGMLTVYRVFRGMAPSARVSSARLRMDRLAEMSPERRRMLGLGDLSDADWGKLAKLDWTVLENADWRAVAQTKNRALRQMSLKKLRSMLGLKDSDEHNEFMVGLIDALPVEVKDDPTVNADGTKKPGFSYDDEDEDEGGDDDGADSLTDALSGVIGHALKKGGKAIAGAGLLF